MVEIEGGASAMPLFAVLALTSALSAVSHEVASCDGNTRQIEACLGERQARNDANLAEYVAAARERIRRVAAETPSGASTVQNAAAGFDAAEAAWSQYRDAACKAVYDYYLGGTIRGIKFLKCRMIMTQEHTHTVWSDWLRYEDSSPPILPEPPPATFP